jgi:hypothetical protein
MDNRPLPLRTLACDGSDFHGDPLLSEMYKRAIDRFGPDETTIAVTGLHGKARDRTGPDPAP